MSKEKKGYFNRDAKLRTRIKEKERENVGQNPPKSSMEREFMIEVGNERLESDPSLKAELYVKSGTLHLVKVLGLGSTKAPATVTNKTTEIALDDDQIAKVKTELNHESGLKYYNPLSERIYDTSPKIIGATLRSDVPIEVPVIDFDVVKKKLITREQLDKLITREQLDNISYKKVNKDEEFHLNLYELMFLLIKPEYGAFFSCEYEVDGQIVVDPKGIQLGIKTNEFIEVIVDDKDNKVPKLITVIDNDKELIKLPTPYLKLVRGSIKADIFEIDRPTSQGGKTLWEIKEGYERFAPLLKKVSRKPRANKQLVKKDITEIPNSVNLIESPDILDDLSYISLAMYDYLFQVYRKSSITSTERAIAAGKQLFNKLEPDKVKNIGSKSGTLHVDSLLRYRPVSGSPRTVGLKVWSDIDIQVPVISSAKDAETDIHPERDLTYRNVKSGEKYDLNLYEAMYLLVRPEYAGFCEAFENPQGAFLSLKFDVKRGIPEPALKVAAPNKLSELSNIEISTIEDVVKENGNKLKTAVLKQEFQEKFGDL
ncbi:hypothetical protein PCCS19_21700 [Paenibacillus sp. CCS19]|uniref:hypothetical protein n=1 Tax=Paenibacillus sp. CCS19 TaxID=3158387 RepID=UPI002560AA51|nr:hypothetical protein [Paenibacillus cellulosilyticus]GMK39116.1 hypothetical protein PCCS19_21700 [Paenibacillus cellulosilyticus]